MTDSEKTAFYYSEPQIELTEDLDHAPTDNMELPTDLATAADSDPDAGEIEVFC